MADSASDKPDNAGNSRRSQADKDKSRQLSRPVSGKEAARTAGRGGRPQGQPGRPGQGNRQGRQGQGRQGQRPQAGRGPAPRQAGRPGAQRPGARRAPVRRPGGPGRSRMSVFTWGAVGLVIVIVAVVVAISQSSSTTTKDIFFNAQPVNGTLLHEISHVPASTFNKVGTGITGQVNVPVVVPGQAPLKVNGKPAIFGLYGEFCPYCAAERWAIIASLSRFGTFTGLKTMQSSSLDVYPKTPTFTFKTAKYSSPYLSAELVELYGQEKATGRRPVLKRPTKSELSIMSKYDKGSTTRSGTIPFMDIGNKVFFPGSSYSPNLLQGLTRTTIAASLKDPNNTLTKIILGVANYISASICAIDGGKPGSVCSSAGVQTAAKALKLKI
jgi:hypothetical protein